VAARIGRPGNYFKDEIIMTRIRMQSQNLQLAIESQRARLQVTSGSRQAQMSIRQTPATMQINRTPARVVVDSVASKDELGIRTMLGHANHAAQMARARVGPAVASIVDEGRSMLSVHNNRRAIQNIAAQRGTNQKSVNIAAMPTRRPVIQIEGGTMNIDWNRGGVEIEVQLANAQVQYQPWSVTISVARYNSLEITIDDERAAAFTYPRAASGRAVNRAV
jgi:hypothetical protein